MKMSGPSPNLTRRQGYYKMVDLAEEAMRSSVLVSAMFLLSPVKFCRARLLSAS
jgi:hypothetical protein